MKRFLLFEGYSSEGYGYESDTDSYDDAILRCKELLHGRLSCDYVVIIDVIGDKIIRAYKKGCGLLICTDRRYDPEIDDDALTINGFNPETSKIIL